MKWRPGLARLLRLAVYLVIMAVGVVLSFFVLPATVRYRVTERYLLDAGRPEVPVRLGVLVPKTGPYQSVSRVGITWDGFASQEPRDEVDLVRLDGVTPEGGRLLATLEYDVTLWQGPARWQAPVEAWQLAPQDEIESDNPLLAGQAARLTGAPSREGAYAIYRFTAGHLDWPSGSRPGDDQSAVAAYQSGVGACGESANLMTALCRAADIPARSITGLALPPTPPLLSRKATWSHPAGSHAWVEVYTGQAWELADPSWASRLPFDRLWFGRNDGMHLSYGERAAHARLLREVQDWAEAGSELVAAMSAPLRFVASAQVEGVTVEPSVTVRKGWDGRWMTMLGWLAGSVLVFSWIERRLRRSV
ncbi:MAG: transglutaminase-like domain-containing protein [Anaerolineae bacterium]|jgi:transglutaminase-like putative cysteine protease